MADIPVKTIREMQAETLKAGRGIACPRCGCCDWRVASTRRDEGMVRRYRVCRNCGEHKTTTEY